MQGQKLGQLTTGELVDATEAVEVLYGLRPYLDSTTSVRIGTLRADLEAEREDRERGRTEATAVAKAEASQAPVPAA